MTPPTSQVQARPGLTGQDVQWWGERLAAAPEPAELHAGRPRPAQLSGLRLARRASLPQPSPATPAPPPEGDGGGERAIAVLAAWAAFVARHSPGGGTRLAVSDHDDWLLVVLDGLEDPPFEELVRATDHALRDARRHRAPLAHLADHLDTADPSRAPLAQVAFDTTGVAWPLSPAPDVVLRLGAEGEMVLDAAADLFDEPALALLEARFSRLLTGALAAPGTALSALPLLSEDEFADLTDRLNPLPTPLPERCLHELLAEVAASQPGKVALIDSTAKLTYAELDGRADALAAELQAAGAGPGKLVGLCTDRSVAMYVGLLGILKSGAAYVPIDPTYPAERVAMMFEDGGVDLVVTEPALAGSLPEGVTPVFAGAQRPAGAKPRPSAAGPSDLAYVIFTSGSTGRPKGVMIEHRSAVNLLRSMARQPGLGADDRWLAITTVSFDMAVPELYLPLLVGATIFVAGRATVVDPRALARLLDEQHITVLQATPATWQMLLDDGWEGAPGLRAFCGGEAMPYPLAQALLPKVAELWNFYGPTETTVWSSVAQVKAGEPIVVGRPMDNTRMYVVGRHLELLPPGVPGELLIGGAGLARGYLGRPDLTAERFVADPFQPGSRAYRTGDLARLRPDGNFECLARLDNQVKIRGFRVELGDVETALADDPSVARAVVVAKKSGVNARLVGYVVPARGSVVLPGPLRRRLRERLPAYMVPSAIEVLESLPLTPNGKVDRRALPEPGPQPVAEDYVAPRDDLERRIIAIWEEVLGVERIGARDNFFELGADSLTAARLFARVRAELGEATPLAPVFEAPTPEQLANLARGGRRSAGGAKTALVPIQPQGSRRPLFCVHGGAGTVLLFQPLARRLGPDQPVYGLQAVGLYGDEAPQTSVTDMAERYVREMRSVQPQGPYRIGGYCYGALVAYEMACQLEDAGERVELLVSFNGPSPAYNQRYDPLFDTEGAIHDEHGQLVERALKREIPLVADVRQQLSAEGPLALRLRKSGGALYRHARKEARRRGRRARLGFYLKLRRPLPDDLRDNGSFQRISRRAQDAYHPRRYGGGMLVVIGEGLYHADDLCWGEHVMGPVEVFIVPGRQPVPRRTMAEPWVSAIAERLSRALAAPA